MSLLNCHAIFKLARHGLWKHCSPPHVSPMFVCSKCYPRALSYHRMTFYSGSTKNQTLKTHKNRAAKGVEGLVSLSTAKT